MAKKQKRFSLKRIPRDMRRSLIWCGLIAALAMIALFVVLQRGAQETKIPESVVGATTQTSNVNEFSDSQSIASDKIRELSDTYEDGRRLEAMASGESYISPLERPTGGAELGNPLQASATVQHNPYERGAAPKDQQQQVFVETVERKAAVMRALFKNSQEVESGIAVVVNEVYVDKAKQSTSPTPRQIARRAPTVRPADVIQPAGAGEIQEYALRTGDIQFIRLVTSINSDEPSPVLGRIIAGPLSGAEVVGQAKRVGEAVIIQFNSLGWKRYTTDINAVAINPATARTALATDVDRRTFTRWMGLALAGAMSGAKDIIESKDAVLLDSGGTAVVKNDPVTDQDIIIGALGGVGDEFSDILKDNFNRPPTVYVDPDAGMLGLLFLEPVNAPWIPSFVAVAPRHMKH